MTRAAPLDTKHSRLVDEVVRRIASTILAGDLRPGDRLTVVPLAQEFGVSQSTMREALLMLGQRGLVSTNPRHGTFVTRLSEQEAVDLCRMRALLEAYTITIGGRDIRRQHARRTARARWRRWTCASSPVTCHS